MKTKNIKIIQSSNNTGVARKKAERATAPPPLREQMGIRQEAKNTILFIIS